MKNKLTSVLICSIAMMMAACSSSSNGTPMSGTKLAEYNETVTKVQAIENLLCDINGMEASDALQLSQLADQLCYTYDANGLDSASIANCQALQQRIEQLKQNIHQTIKDNMHNIYVAVVSDDDCLVEKKTAYPVISNAAINSM